MKWKKEEFMTWIDYTIIGGLAVVVGGIVFYLIKEKRKGKSGCGCGCSGCPHAGTCGGKSVVKTENDDGTEENV